MKTEGGTPAKFLPSSAAVTFSSWKPPGWRWGAQGRSELVIPFQSCSSSFCSWMPVYLPTLLAPDNGHVSRRRCEDLHVCWRDRVPSQQLHPLPLVTLRKEGLAVASPFALGTTSSYFREGEWHLGGPGAASADRLGPLVPFP